MNNIFFNLFLVVFAVIFVSVVALVIKAIYNTVAEKRYNDSQPILTKAAKISAKRTEVTGGRGNHSASTFYYATFEFADNKERIELEIDPEDYGLLAEGDSGNLTFQGRRYHKFQRNL
jgi:hypothetical protein